MFREIQKNTKRDKTALFFSKMLQRFQTNFAIGYGGNGNFFQLCCVKICNNICYDDMKYYARLYFVPEVLIRRYTIY